MCAVTSTVCDVTHSMFKLVKWLQSETAGLHSARGSFSPSSRSAGRDKRWAEMGEQRSSIRHRRRASKACCLHRRRRQWCWAAGGRDTPTRPGQTSKLSCDSNVHCSADKTSCYPGTGSSPGVPAPKTPSPSFTGAETLGAGLESLRAPSQQSASTPTEDPEAGCQLLASCPGSTSGILSQGRRIVLSLDWATVPTHHQRLMCASAKPMSLEQATKGSVHGLCTNGHCNVTSKSPRLCR